MLKEYKSREEFKEALKDMDAIEIYKEVLRGKYIKIFPMGFWQQPEAKENSIKVTKYMIEGVLKWNEEDIKEKLRNKTFSDNKLKGMIQTIYHNSSINTIINTYPDKFKPWEFKYLLNKYWQDENNIKEAVKWLIEEKLKWNEEDIKEKYCFNTLRDNGFNALTNYKLSLYELINLVYPDKFKPWELKSVSNKYWKDENNIKEAMKWLIEDKLEWNEEDIKEKYCQETLKDNGLYSLIQYKSLYQLIDFIYPNKFKPTDFKNYNRFKKEINNHERIQK